MFHPRGLRRDRRGMSYNQRLSDCKGSTFPVASSLNKCHTNGWFRWSMGYLVPDCQRFRLISPQSPGLPVDRRFLHSNTRESSQWLRLGKPRAASRNMRYEAGQLLNTYWALASAPYAISGGLNNDTSYLDPNISFNMNQCLGRSHTSSRTSNRCIEGKPCYTISAFDEVKWRFPGTKTARGCLLLSKTSPQPQGDLWQR